MGTVLSIIYIIFMKNWLKRVVLSFWILVIIEFILIE